MEPDQSFLDRVEDLLKRAIAPQAAALDDDSGLLHAAMTEFGKHHLLALRVPQQWGGAGVSETTFRYFQELVARYSGALAFLQAQHQSAGSLLVKSGNEPLKQQLLPAMGMGKALVGISFAHLRRQPSPVVAIAVPGGYRMQGEAPWVTGYGIFQSFIVAAALPDGQVVYGIAPFTTTAPSADGQLICGEPMALAAMTATATVTVQFHDWFMPDQQVVCVSPRSAIATSDRLNVLHHSFFALGCASAALAIVETAYQQKQLAFIYAVYLSLQAELAACRQAILTAPADSNCFEENVQLRAWAIELAVRCAHAAVAASSGAANSSNHPAQRIYREALVYTVAGQTTAVMEATLGRLVQRTLVGEGRC